MGRKVNLRDFAITIDMLNTILRLKLGKSSKIKKDLEHEFDILRYVSAEAIYESKLKG